MTELKFTDDDIEKYRIIIKTNDPTHQDWWFALLTRLEAAEHKAELGWLNRVYIPKNSVGDRLDIEKADDAWREASGK